MSVSSLGPSLLLRGIFERWGLLETSSLCLKQVLSVAEQSTQARVYLSPWIWRELIFVPQKSKLKADLAPGPGDGRSKCRLFLLTRDLSFDPGTDGRDRSGRRLGCYVLFIEQSPGAWGARHSGPRARAAAPLAGLLLAGVAFTAGLTLGQQVPIQGLPALRGLSPAPRPACHSTPLLLQPRVQLQQQHQDPFHLPRSRAFAPVHTVACPTKHGSHRWEARRGAESILSRPPRPHIWAHRRLGQLLPLVQRKKQHDLGFPSLDAGFLTHPDRVSGLSPLKEG